MQFMALRVSAAKSRKQGVRAPNLGGLMLMAMLPSALSPAAVSFGASALPVTAVSLAAAVVVESFSASARAAAPGEESPQVEELLRQGIQLRRDGQDEAALAVFLKAEAQAPNSVRVLLHVATAAQAASKWLMADEYLRKATSHEDDPYYQRYKAEIDDVRAATAQRVGHFRAVGTPEGAEVILNGQVVGNLPMDTPKTLEAGTYVLEVNKPGYYRLRRPVAVPGGVLTRETVELNERTGAAPDPADVTADANAAAAEPKAWWAQSWVTWTLGGLAVASGATSGAAFFARNRAASHWNDDTRCLSPEQPSLSRAQVCGSVRNDIDTAEQVAIISGAAAAVFAGAAITQWIASSGSKTPAAPNDSAQHRERNRGSIECSPGVLSVMCAGTF
jgi:hypothetical protein